MLTSRHLQQLAGDGASAGTFAYAVDDKDPLYAQADGLDIRFEMGELDSQDFPFAQLFRVRDEPFDVQVEFGMNSASSTTSWGMRSRMSSHCDARRRLRRV